MASPFPGMDPFIEGQRWRDFHHALIEEIRAVLPPIPWLRVDDHISAALEQLATKLGALGCTVKRAQPEGMGGWREHHKLYRTLMAVMTGASIAMPMRVTVASLAPPP